jgi:hypothetical protein
MMLLSGYTLGFFYPARTKDLSADRPDARPGRTPDEKADGDVDPPPAGSPERPEVPASLYFYRYF